MESYIHPTADVEPRAIIGPGTRVWHRAHIRDGAEIGAGCTIGKDVYIDKDVRIGAGTKIQNGVSVYTGVDVAEYCFLGPHCTFTNDLHPRAWGNWELTRTFLERGVSIGAHATIVCGIRIRQFALIAAGAVVTADVEPFRLMKGSPARAVAYVCSRGHRMTLDYDSPGDRAPHPHQQYRCAQCHSTLSIHEFYYERDHILDVDWRPWSPDLVAGRTPESGPGQSVLPEDVEG